MTEFQAGSTDSSDQGTGSESGSVGTKRIESIQLGGLLDEGRNTGEGRRENDCWTLVTRFKLSSCTETGNTRRIAGL